MPSAYISNKVVLSYDFFVNCQFQFRMPLKTGFLSVIDQQGDIISPARNKSSITNTERRPIDLQNLMI